MVRSTLRRLAIIPPALLLINFAGFAYAHLVRPIRAARSPYLRLLPETEPLLPTYAAYLQNVLHFDFGAIPGSQEPIATTISRAGTASLGLLALALALSTVLGLLLGFWATRSNPPGVSRWLPPLSTVGLAMPSFYIGILCIVASISYIFWRGAGTEIPFPIQGFGWDRHLVLPTLALMARPTVQIAQMTSELLAGELRKQYIVTARSVGVPWLFVRWRHALRNILAPVILTIAGSLRLLVGELVVVENLFAWPGLGRLLAWTLIPGRVSGGGASLGAIMFLDPPVIAAVLTAIAGFFLLADFAASVLVRAVDPRLRAPEGETPSV